MKWFYIPFAILFVLVWWVVLLTAALIGASLRLGGMLEDFLDRHIK